MIWLLLAVCLQYGVESQVIAPIAANYPTRVPGTCGSTTFFDCGGGNCINFTSVRDCIVDCADGSDELCGQGLSICDVGLPGAEGCGNCYNPLTAIIENTCRDRRWQNLCQRTGTYKCATTLNCVFQDWVLDGTNECADWSDENPCIENRANRCSANALCTFTAATQVTDCTCNVGFSGDGVTCTAISTASGGTTTTATTTTTTPTTTSTSTTTTTPTTTPITTATSITTATTGTATSTSTTTTTTTTTTSTSTPPNTGACPEFACVRGGCVLDTQVLDGKVDCPNDSSDEDYCTTQLVTCPDQCAYSVSTHRFACGCDDQLTVRNASGYCIPSTYLPFDCADIIGINSNAVSGVERLYNPLCLTPSRAICQFYAYCDQSTLQGGWTMLLRKSNDTFNFSRSYSEYKTGFGNESQDYYIGNDVMHRISSMQPYELAVAGRFAASKQAVAVRYKNFSIGTEASGYALRIGGIKDSFGTTADELLKFNGSVFSARDQGPLASCATAKEGGWWWSAACSAVGALTVPLIADPIDANVKGIFWGGQNLSAVTLLIRPADYKPPPGKPLDPIGSSGCSIYSGLSIIINAAVVVLLFARV
uniref:Fibrinogen C-terminal domain-containing protein n=1 Tax=Plectus sambesii TaxID=2011161 RepID=A0A914WZI1_9BILA